MKRVDIPSAMGGGSAQINGDTHTGERCGLKVIACAS